MMILIEQVLHCTTHDSRGYSLGPLLFLLGPLRCAATTIERNLEHKREKEQR